MNPLAPKKRKGGEESSDDPEGGIPELGGVLHNACHAEDGLPRHPVGVAVGSDGGIALDPNDLDWHAVCTGDEVVGGHLVDRDVRIVHDHDVIDRAGIPQGGDEGPHAGSVRLTEAVGVEVILPGDGIGEVVIGRADRYGGLGVRPRLQTGSEGALAAARNALHDDHSHRCLPRCPDVLRIPGLE